MAENRWFKFRVIETVTTEKVYTLRAPTEEEARGLAERGVGVYHEGFVKDGKVVNREVLEQIKVHQ